MVAEADESDRSFLKLTPTVAVVTNIDREHLDTYRDLADVQEAFLGFVNKVPFYGAAVLCLDDGPGAGHPAARRAPRRHLRPLAAGAGLGARRRSSGPTGSHATPRSAQGTTLGAIELAVPGAHNVLNSLAAVAVGPRPRRRLRRTSRPGLAAFTGVDRRFQVRGEAGGVTGGRRLRPPPDGDPRHARDAARPRGHAGARWCSSSPTATRARSTCGTSSAAPSTWPTSLLLTDIYPAGEEPIDGSHAPRRWPTRSARRGHRQRRLRGRPARPPTERLAARGARRRRRADPGRGQRVDGRRRAAQAAGRVSERRTQRRLPPTQRRLPRRAAARPRRSNPRRARTSRRSCARERRTRVRRARRGWPAAPILALQLAGGAAGRGERRSGPATRG